jgi:hypothetical protein
MSSNSNTEEDPLNIRIPEDLKFSDLQLARDPLTGDISFDWTPIERICEASGIDIAIFDDEEEDALSELIIEWYQAHLASGGAPDPVQEELIAEADNEESRDD